MNWMLRGLPGQGRGLSEARTQRLLYVCCLLFSLLSVEALLRFALMGQPQAARLHGMGLGVALATWLCLRRGWLVLGSGLFVGGTVLSLTYLTYQFDLPDADTPRTMHLQLLPLMLMLQLFPPGRVRWLRWGLQLALIGLLLGLSLVPAPPDAPRLLDPAQRAFGALVVVGSVLGLLAYIAHLADADWLDQTDLELDLARAIARGQLSVHLQPQCNAAHQLLGAELLVRWQDARRGWVSPAKFIPAAERSGLILPLGEQVLRQALQLQQGWAGGPLYGLPLAVNVSALQMRDAAHMRRLLQHARRAELPPGALKFELTESALADDVPAMAEWLAQCRAQGIASSLDDFGTGYASLATLSRLPFDQLKIDQSFVNQLVENPRSRRIARTVIELSEKLHVAVIAEGVETAEQVALLVRMGCHHFQGYHFAKPMPLEAFEAWARQHDRAEA